MSETPISGHLDPHQFPDPVFQIFVCITPHANPHHTAITCYPANHFFFRICLLTVVDTAKPNQHPAARSLSGKKKDKPHSLVIVAMLLSSFQPAFLFSTLPLFWPKMLNFFITIYIRYYIYNYSLWLCFGELTILYLTLGRVGECYFLIWGRGGGRGIQNVKKKKI